MTKLYLIAFMAISIGLKAQSCACCTEVHQQFDFWLGDWEVVDTNGTALGKNSISQKEGHCILAEHWTGASGGTGSSVNYYNPADSSWNQLWISANGYILELKGAWNAAQQAMILKSKEEIGQNGQKFRNQITWTPNNDGTVIQRWDLIKADQSIIRTLFYGIYRKK